MIAFFKFVWTIILSWILHRKQKYGYRSYFKGHIIPVMKRVDAMYGRNYRLLSIAALHDTIEDTGVSEDWLVKHGVDPYVAKMVSILSKQKDVNYNDYIANIAAYEDAFHVKYADMLCNYSSSILSMDARRINKYKKGLHHMCVCRTNIIGRYK